MEQPAEVLRERKPRGKRGQGESCHALRKEEVMIHRGRVLALIGTCMATMMSCQAHDSVGQAQDLPLWQASVDARIGTALGPGPTFGQITGMAATPEGTVLVIDAQARHVLEFDSVGDLIRRFGAAGQGPGEFWSPAYVGLLQGLVWVTDESQRRVTYFTREGEPVRTTSLRLSAEMHPQRLSMARGPLGMKHYVAPVSMSAMAIPDWHEDRLPIVKIDEVGRVVDTLAFSRLSNSVLVVRHPDRPWSGLAGPQPFATKTHWAILPDCTGILVVDVRQDDPAIIIVEISERGDTVWSRTHPFSPVSIPSRQLEAVRADLAEMVLKARGPGAATAAAARHMVDQALYVPPFLPAVTDLVVAEDGDVLLRREPPRDGDPQRWTLFSNGEAVADLAIPDGVFVRAASDRVLWGILLDEWSVQYVVRLRIEPSPVSCGPDFHSAEPKASTGGD